MIKRALLGVSIGLFSIFSLMMMPSISGMPNPIDTSNSIVEWGNDVEVVLGNGSPSDDKDVKKADKKVQKKQGKWMKAVQKCSDTEKEKDCNKAIKKGQKLCKEANKQAGKLAKKGKSSDFIDGVLANPPCV